MEIADLITTGGGWGVGVAVCWLVGTGKLRLAREYEELEQTVDRLTESNERQTSLLNETQAKEREALRASVAAAEQRTVEIGSRLDRLIDQGAGQTPGRTT